MKHHTLTKTVSIFVLLVALVGKVGGLDATTDIKKSSSINFTSSEDLLPKEYQDLAHKDLTQLAVNICAKYAGNGSLVADKVEKEVLDFMILKKQEHTNLDEVAAPTTKEIIRFLNKYKNYMLCGNTNY